MEDGYIQHEFSLLFYRNIRILQVVTREYPIRTHADALRLGEENLYIDGVTPFSGPVRSGELEEVIRKRLEAKGLLWRTRHSP